ncbi:hypothetical protein KXV35_008205, partial [Aspergillus fumigatus]
VKKRPRTVLQKSTGARPQQLSKGIQTRDEMPIITTARLTVAGMPMDIPKSPAKAPKLTQRRMACFQSQLQFRGSLQSSAGYGMRMVWPSSASFGFLSSFWRVSPSLFLLLATKTLRNT